MPFQPPDKMRTQRLLLRKPRLEDAQALYANYASDPNVARFTTWQAHSSSLETNEFLVHCLEEWRNGKGFPYVIAQPDADDAPFGMIHPHRGESLELLLQRSDQALYQAKARGRNCVAA